MQLILPKLVSSFKCLAADCPSTCCREWNITWRESEIKKLALCGNKEIKDKISTAFCTDGDYYSINHKGGECPFLQRDGLCKIHKEIGEEYLSYVCREYPRISRVIDDIAIKSCKTSCYEVMDIILSDDDCMDIDSSDTANIEAIITPEDECFRRVEIFNKLSKTLWDDKLSYYNKEEIKKFFSDIFGFELITSNEKQDVVKYCCENSEENLTRAIFLEWLINGFKAEFSDEANLSCLDFCLGAARLAFKGAVKYSENHSQLVMTMCDIIGFLLSNTKKIIMYLSQNNL